MPVCMFVFVSCVRVFVWDSSLYLRFVLFVYFFACCSAHFYCLNLFRSLFFRVCGILAFFCVCTCACISWHFSLYIAQYFWHLVFSISLYIVTYIFFLYFTGKENCATLCLSRAIFKHVVGGYVLWMTAIDMWVIDR